MAKNLESFLQQIEKLKTTGAVDLSADEDLSLAVMNLVSLEEHFFFTGAKLGQEKYYDLSQEAREIRKQLMRELLPAAPGETWCASKHLLAAAMRLIETGQKYRATGQAERSVSHFKQAYRLYALFWALKLGLADVRAFAGKSLEQPLSVEDLVAKLANCCDE